MKTLYLLRHAKSSWKDETLLDIERPLSGRGRNAAKIVGSFLKNQKIIPDLVLCSSAVRARQTIELVTEAAKLRTDLRFDERIYEASAQRILEVVTQIEKSNKTALLVGHNPGLEEFLSLVTGTRETVATATLSKLVLKITNWTSVAAKTGTLEWIVKPKQLKKLEADLATKPTTSASRS